MNIVRIEHETEGTGIWRTHINGYDIDKCIPELHQRHRGDFPTPAWDVFPDEFHLNGNYFCAYKSIEQIREWVMPEEIKTLTKYGFKVYLIEIEKCSVGAYQVLFFKEDIINKIDITDLFL